MTVVGIGALTLTNEVPRDQAMRYGVLLRKAPFWSKKPFVVSKVPFTVWHPTDKQLAVREYVKTLADQMRGQRGFVTFENKKGEKVTAPRPAKILHDAMLGKKF